MNGIKRLERNNAVRGQLVMWMELLTMGPDMHWTAYLYLSLGRAAEFSFDYGINDADWLARERADQALTDGGPQGSLYLV